MPRLSALLFRFYGQKMQKFGRQTKNLDFWLLSLEAGGKAIDLKSLRVIYVIGKAD
jgi:hypothetical protein